MSKTVKRWLLAAASLVLIGIMIFGGVLAMSGWDFKKLSTVRYESNHYEIKEDYRNISIRTKTAHVVLVPSEDGECSVECYEESKVKHSVSVKDGTLVIEVTDTRKWYDYVGINFDTPKITVRIPKGAYGAFSLQSRTGDVEIAKDFVFESIDISESTGHVTNYASASGNIKITTSTGNISLENISAHSLDLSVSTGTVTVSGANCVGDVRIDVSTGKAHLSEVVCQNVISDGSTGDISFRHVIARGQFSIERDTGHITFDRCDAAELFIRTSTGDVSGSLLTEKVFLVNTDTGKKEVPKTITGGKCEITTDTGDVIISIAP